MKNIVCICVAVASTAALAQSSATRMVSPAQMPLQASTSKADDGFSSLSNEPDRVRRFFNDLEIVKGRQASAVPTAPLVVRKLADLKLGFTPASVRTGKLIGVAPQGTLVNGAWTGVERYFQIEGGGYLRISETDMAASGGMFYMNKAAVNTTVAGKPAISVVFTDDQGRRVEEVLWVNGPKLYTVTYAPDLQPGSDGMLKADTALSAFALANELR